MTDLRILSLGAGVQSTTLALMAEAGEIEKPDYAIFADTQWEPRAVYNHLDWLETKLSFPILRVSRGHLRDEAVRYAQGEKLPHSSRPQPPFHLRLSNGKPGMSRRQCTREYKILPITGEIRRLLGVERGAQVPRSTRVIVMIGISTDEAMRMKPARHRWQSNVWPLIDAQMSRMDCIAWLLRNKYPQPAKSSCIGCPYHSDAHWLTLTPDEFSDAVEFERLMQTGDIGFSGATPFLHRSLVPLDQVDFSRWQDRNQLDLFGEECEGMCGV